MTYLHGGTCLLSTLTTVAPNGQARVTGNFAFKVTAPATPGSFCHCGYLSGNQMTGFSSDVSNKRKGVMRSVVPGCDRPYLGRFRSIGVYDTRYLFHHTNIELLYRFMVHSFILYHHHSLKTDDSSLLPTAGSTSTHIIKSSSKYTCRNLPWII